MTNKFNQGAFFHVFNKSIAGFGIFKDPMNCQRFIYTLDYYNNLCVKEKLSNVIRSNKYHYENLIYVRDNQKVKTLCFNIMPTHYHLVLKVNKDNILSKYIGDVENSYTRFFNQKFDRKGPLWQSRFKAVRIETEEQLLHVTRYVHLNAVTSRLVNLPEDWQFSSYKDFISNKIILKEIITEISISDPNQYKKFVENNIDYQRKLHLIKKIIIE